MTFLVSGSVLRLWTAIHAPNWFEPEPVAAGGSGNARSEGEPGSDVSGAAGRGLGGGSVGEGNLNSPFRRTLGLAGRAFATWALAFAFATFLLSSQVQTASADEQTTTVHIRGEADDASETENAQKDASDEDSGLFEVGERDDPTTQPKTSGDVIVGLALAYVGYPYAWAGNSPAGFDCSGFAQFVMLNTLGIDIGHAIEGQPGAGVWVDWGSWQPGDLVFFQNTYRAGLSHVGIYVGDGLFVHAENEGTGVIVSSMYSEYYGPRYWGSVRAG